MCIIQSKFSRTNPQTLKWRRGVCVRRSWIRPCCVTPTKRLDRVDTSDLKDMADGSHFLWNFRFRGGVSLESALYKINVWCKLKFLPIKQFLPQIWCQYNVFLCKKKGGGVSDTYYIIHNESSFYCECDSIFHYYHTSGI